MARIAIVDTTRPYDGQDMGRRPLGGTETSVIQLAEALAARGHDVSCHTAAAADSVHNRVRWIPLGGERPDRCDLLVAVQHPALLRFARRPRRRALWVVWPPIALRRWRAAARLWWYRPLPVFVSRLQAAAYASWLPGARPPLIIPLGLPAAVRGRPALAEAPPPRAIFASNPQRGLAWLLDLWAHRILPVVPGAEIHLYGIRDYAYRYVDPWEETPARLDQFIPPGFPAAALGSLKPHPPAPREVLWDAMRGSRVMLYGGHRAEAFCLAVAEAQALGVPAVVRPITVLPDRVHDGVTGYVAAEENAFAARAIALMTDDALWRRQHEAALTRQQGSSWDDVAACFEARVFQLPSGG